jgi:hypothetical protein
MWYMTWKRINAAYSVGVGKPQGKNHVEDPDVDGRIILKRILKE